MCKTLGLTRNILWAKHDEVWPGFKCCQEKTPLPRIPLKQAKTVVLTPVKRSAVNVEVLTAGVCAPGRVKQRSREGLEAARMELEEREKVAEELHAIQVWLQAAHGLLAEMEQSSGTEELQVGNFLVPFVKQRGQVA